MKIVDGHGDGEHVTARQVADTNIGIFGPGDYVLDVGDKFAYEIVTNNEISIGSGVGITQGVRFINQENEQNKVFIANGTQAKFRNDLIVAKYKKDGSTSIESFELSVVKGTPADSKSSVKDPVTVKGDLRNNALEHEVILYRVSLEGLNIVAVERLFEVLPRMGKITARPKALGLPVNPEDGDICILY